MLQEAALCGKLNDSRPQRVKGDNSHDTNTKAVYFCTNKARSDWLVGKWCLFYVALNVKRFRIILKHLRESVLLSWNSGVLWADQISR